MLQSFYKWAENHMVIDMEDEILICHVPDQCGEWFKVTVDENQLVPTPVHCTCRKHKQHSSCSHIEIVTAFYSRIYKSNVAKVKKVVKIATPVIEAPKLVKKLDFHSDRTASFFGNLPSRRLAPTG